MNPAKQSEAHWLIRSTLIALLISPAVGCIKAPDVIIVDRYTALEVQASGNYAPLEDELQDEGLALEPENYTSDQIAPSADEEENSSLGEVYRGVISRTDRIDALRRRKCVGESIEGLLVQLEEDCKGRVDEQDIANLLERENRNRRQVWHFIEEQNPDAPPEDIRQAWRVDYLKTLPCGSPVQQSETNWGIRECDE